jgi:hypothetical protein
LNRAYCAGSLGLAALVGWLGQSWATFALALVVLLAANLASRRSPAGRPAAPLRGAHLSPEDGMRNRGPLPSLIAAALTVAVICGLLFEGSWLVGPPIVLAVAVAVVVARRID